MEEVAGLLEPVLCVGGEDSGKSTLTLAGKSTALHVRLPMPFLSHERQKVTTSRYKDSDFQSLHVIRKKKKL